MIIDQEAGIGILTSAQEALVSVAGLDMLVVSQEQIPYYLAILMQDLRYIWIVTGIYA